MEFVQEKLPLKSKVLVVRGVQVLSGVAGFVEVRRTYGPPGVPFMPLSTNLFPDRVAELMLGFGKGASRNVPFTVSSLVSQARPVPVVGGIILVKVPL